MRVFRLERSAADRTAAAIVVAGRLLGAGVQRHELASRARPEHLSVSSSIFVVIGKGKRFVAPTGLVVVAVAAALPFALSVLSCA
jgi:hypothetical protein